MPKEKLTLDELLQKIPDELKPVAAKWAPVLLDMAHEEVMAWMELFLLGKNAAAYAVLYNRMETSSLITGWETLVNEWEAAADSNADRLEAQRNIVYDVLLACFKMGLVLLPAGL